MKPPRFLLVDIDNTVYPYKPCFETGIHLAQVVGSEYVEQWSDVQTFMTDYDHARTQVKQTVGQEAASHCRLLYFKRMLENAGGRTRIRETRAMHDAYWSGYWSKMVLAEDCLEVLQRFVREGIRFAWLTSYTTERQMLKLLELGLDDISELMISAEEVGIDKPSTRTIEYALARLEADPNQTWMIGDDPKDDIPAAKQAGLTAVWFRRDTSEPKVRPDFIVDNWKQVGSLIGSPLQS